MTTNKPMTGEQLDELMTVAVNMQRDSEKAGERSAAMFAYAVQVAVLELRKVREVKPTDEDHVAAMNSITAIIAILGSSDTLGISEQVAELKSQRDAMAAENAGLKVLAFNPALLDVISERQRQMSVEGWTSEHDDAYQNSELADAAACYAIHAHNQGFSTPAHWPWAPEWWKPTNPRRDLVKAGALILAEIERIDRQEAAQ